MKRLALPKLSKWSRRERLLAVGSLLVVCGLVLDQLVLEPWSRHTRKIRQEIVKLEQAIHNHQQLLSRKPQILAEADSVRQYLRPESAGELDRASLLREIEALGVQSGVSLGDLKPQEAPANELSQEYVVEVGCRGTLQQWVHFLYLLQTSPSQLQIERATLEPVEQDSELVEGSFRLMARTSRGPQPL